MTARIFQVFHDHRHRGDDGTDCERQAAEAFTPLRVSDVVQPGSLDQITLGRIVELAAIPGDEHVIASALRVG